MKYAKKRRDRFPRKEDMAVVNEPDGQNSKDSDCKDKNTCRL